MKRCPECRRDYYDDTLMYCLDDGNALLEGPASGKSEPPASAGGQFDEPQTAILSEPGAVATGFRDTDESQTALLPDGIASEAATRAQIHTTAAEPQSLEAALPKKQILSANRAAKPLLAAIGLLVIILGGFFGYRYLKPADPGQINSIAILPFENRTGSADSEYLSDGLAESLIYRLSQLPALKVSPTSSVFRYKGKETDPQEVAKELDVDSVMTGRITQRGDDVTISVNLVDTRDGRSLWGEQYERKLSELLTTQREIAAEIASKLRLRLTGNEKALTKNYTDSSEAYQLYLKGRYSWNKRTGESLRQAVGFFNQAVEKDPNFALAYSGLAETYVIFNDYAGVPSAESMPLAKDAALRALELDESLAEAHAAYATYLLKYEYDMVRSEAEYRRAIELNPGYPTAHQWLGELLGDLKRFDEGMAEVRKAQELDPLSPVISFNIGWQHLIARRYDEALAAFDATLIKFPDFKFTQTGRCWAFYAKRDLANAVPVCRKALELFPSAASTGYLAMVLGRAGQVDEAKVLIDQLKKGSEDGSVTGTALAFAYTGLGEKESALRMLEQAVEKREYLTFEFGVCPEFDELRSEPRFKALLKRMNLPE